MVVDQPTVNLWKNPYHLYQTFLERKERFTQKKSADLLVTMLKEHSGPTQIDKGRFSTIVQEDYLDFGDTAWLDKHSLHFQAMGKIIARKWAPDFDILSLPDRRALEESIGYKYPDGGQQITVGGLHALRGVWQLAHASALAEDIRRRREPHHIRTAILLVHGFLEDDCLGNNKRYIKAIIIGRTGVWKARAWIKTKRLFVTAEECATKEDQFYIFKVPDFEDPFAQKRFSSMRGVMTGIVLDENYNTEYPIVAATCTARRVPGATRFFEANDQCIDSNLIGQLRQRLPCDYFSPPELLERSKSLEAGNAADIEHEFYHSLDTFLGEILDQHQRVSYPLVV